MKLLATTTLFLVAILSAQPLHAQALPSKTGEGRQATRCAVFYLLMSKVPAMAKDKARLEGLVDGLGRIATEKGASNEDMDSWTKEYMTEAVENSQKPKSTFNQDQSTTCELFLATHGATRIPTPPAKDLKAGVMSRHSNGRPASISALDHVVTFDEGSGAACDKPVVMGQAEEKQSRIRAQYIWLDDVYPGWKLVSRATRYSEPPSETNIDNLKIYSWFSLEGKAGKAFEVCFDTTQGMLPDLKALAH